MLCEKWQTCSLCVRDAAKAFDKVLHFRLFSKILSKGVPAVFVSILICWYSHLQSTVLWKSVLEECFKVVSGVRQGGVLSPYLFALYIQGGQKNCTLPFPLC